MNQLKKPKPSPQAFDEYEDFIFENEFHVDYMPHNTGTYNVRLWGPIQSPNQMRRAIMAFERASEDDDVVVHLSSLGGSLEAADAFISAMQSCSGRVVVRATGGNHSAATLILLSANEIQLSDDFHALVHNGSLGAVGNFNEVAAQAKFTIPWMEGVLRKYYSGFLTPDELDQLFSGKDFWFGPEEFVERFQRKGALLVEQSQKAECNGSCSGCQCED